MLQLHVGCWYVCFYLTWSIKHFLSTDWLYHTSQHRPTSHTRPPTKSQHRWDISAYIPVSTVWPGACGCRLTLLLGWFKKVKCSGRIQPQWEERGNSLFTYHFRCVQVESTALSVHSALAIYRSFETLASPLACTSYITGNCLFRTVT